VPPSPYELLSLWILLPEIILLAGGCVALLLGQATGAGLRHWTPRVALAAILLAMIAAMVQARAQADPAGGLGLEYGALAIFARNGTLMLGFVITLVAWFQPPHAERGEFWSMLLFALAGVLLVGAANDLLLLCVALEVVSIPTYIMVALSRRNVRAPEAATKYFFLGALAAALLASGFALLYGVAGSTSLPVVVQAVQESLSASGPVVPRGLAAIGVVLSLAGLLFKIAAVPLHFYIADVYQGAASAVAGLLGFVPKFAGFLAIFKIMVTTGHWQQASPSVFWVLWVVAVVSMTVGNTLALLQTNIKRMLAYSGVAHSGYMLVGVLIGPAGGHGSLGDGTAAVLYYVVIYGLANLGAFAILGLLRVRGQPCETLRDVAGLLRRHASLALLMTLAMFTLMGLPPTAGFWGKLSLFGGALAGVAGELAPTQWNNWLVALVVIAMLNSALAAAYYLRVIAAVLLYESDHPAEAVTQETPHVGALLCGLLLIVFAFVPGLLLDRGREATLGLRGGLVGAGVQRPAVPVADRAPGLEDGPAQSDQWSGARAAEGGGAGLAHGDAGSAGGVMSAHSAQIPPVAP
jgi:NADH-quinone oxidoreductase subunit N